MCEVSVKNPHHLTSRVVANVNGGQGVSDSNPRSAMYCCVFFSFSATNRAVKISKTVHTTKLYVCI